MRKNAEIKVAVESAFKPYRCAAEIWDYERKLRFKVFDGERVVANMPRLILRTVLRDDSELRMILDAVRQEITDQGLLLDPWELK